MLINRKNMERYMPEERLINVPRMSIFMTLLLHMGIMFFGQLLFVNVLVYIAAPIIFYEMVYGLWFLRRMWKRAGYSGGLYVFLYIVFFIGGAFLSGYVRDLMPIVF